MKKLYYLSFVLLLLFLANSCKKEVDNVTQQTISGMVYNQCTDSGLANVQVYLKINKDNSSFESLETMSGINGAFSFANVDIHSNSKYTYALNILSKSGIGGTKIGFDGATLSFNYNEASNYFRPRVTPRYLELCYQSNIQFPIILPDSLYIYIVQKTLHKNVPILPYFGIISNNSTINSCTGNYPMGLWNCTIDKWKNGIHTTTQDSIYLGWGATKTFTFNW